MKIIFDHQIFGWQKFGGISRYAFEVASQLSLMPELEVTTLSPLHINHYLDSAPNSLKKIGIKVPQFDGCGRVYRSINNVLSVPAYRSINPDIVHETYYAKCKIAPKRSKVILTVYDMIHERFTSDFSKFDPLRKEKIAAVHRADHVICISQQTQKDLIQLLDINPEKTSVIHLGFSLTKSDNNGVNLHYSKPYLLYVGRRDGYKNFSGLLKAYAASKQLKQEFLLICFGGGAFTQIELDEMGQLGVDESHVKQVSGDDDILAHLYSNAVLFVYPSLYEGFGIPPLEAMSFNCPVACSNTSSIPEVVGDAAAFFEPTSVDSIVESIEQVVNDRPLMNSLIQKGTERVKHFSWKACAQNTLKIYREVLA